MLPALFVNRLTYLAGRHGTGRSDPPALAGRIGGTNGTPAGAGLPLAGRIGAPGQPAGTDYQVGRPTRPPGWPWAGRPQDGAADPIPGRHRFPPAP